MTTHSSILAWEIPWTEEPGGLQYMGLQRVWYNWTIEQAWNLERWYWWTYLQGSIEDADIENRLIETVGEGDSRTDWDSSIETYILP